MADLETIADEICTPSEMLHKWFDDKYSTSKHIPMLDSIPIGLKAKTIVEVGFGRSTIALCYVAKQLDAKFICCDRHDYSAYLGLLEDEDLQKCTRFIQGDAKSLFKTDHMDNGVDFMFLDYFSSRERSADSIYKAIYRFLPYMKQNGIIAVHDTIEKKYFVKDAFKRLRKDKGLEVLSLPYNYGLGLIRKLGESKYGKIEDEWKKKSDS
ncbi:MAG: class I SAM-dependent methyltransferase [PVC group bacterium]|nr:class I SAM-dependent methyltransferase [PVC group bacterium]